MSFCRNSVVEEDPSVISLKSIEVPFCESVVVVKQCVVAKQSFTMHHAAWLRFPLSGVFLLIFLEVRFFSFFSFLLLHMM